MGKVYNDQWMMERGFLDVKTFKDVVGTTVVGLGQAATGIKYKLKKEYQAPVSETLARGSRLSDEDVTDLKARGFKSVVNNRPDFEHGPDQPTSAQVEAAAQAAGEPAWLARRALDDHANHEPAGVMDPSACLHDGRAAILHAQVDTRQCACTRGP